MRTWKQNIPEGKYQRVKKDRASQVVKVDGGKVIPVGVIYACMKLCSSYVLGDYMYTKEFNTDLRQVEYFRYRVKPIAAYTIDYSYYEHRLQMEKQ
jgi:hypothetical protein